MIPFFEGLNEQVRELELDVLGVVSGGEAIARDHDFHESLRAVGLVACQDGERADVTVDVFRGRIQTRFPPWRTLTVFGEAPSRTVARLVAGPIEPGPPFFEESRMRLAPLVLTAAAALTAAVHLDAETKTTRLEKRIEKALTDAAQRTESDLREILEAELHPGTPLAKIRAQITFDDCRDTVFWLADDERGGRDTGSEGHGKAAQFVADRMAEAGLQPAGDDQGWFQRWKFGRRQTMNVVGLLPGETDEIVVVGAHLDHVGTGAAGFLTGRMPHPLAGDDKIYNGADDNASGSTAVLMMACALGRMKAKPRRGILFTFFSGEEKGLLGSRYYCEHPLFPLEKTVAMLNFDMVGRNKDHECEVLGKDVSPELAEMLDAANLKTGLKLSVPEKSPIMWMQSDQWSYYQAKVPCLFFTTGGHGQYHTALDHPDLINHGKIEEIAELGALLALDVANDDGKYSCNKLSLGPKLGVTPQPLADAQLAALGLKEKEGGVLLAQIQKGMPAEKAGLKAGDVVIAFDGKSLPRKNTLEAFRKKIQDAKPGSEQKVTVIRNTKRETYVVTYEK
jgi:hypothetical protein